jgi:hypothetical protein
LRAPSVEAHDQLIELSGTVALTAALSIVFVHTF